MCDETMSAIRKDTGTEVWYNDPTNSNESICASCHSKEARKKPRKKAEWTHEARLKASQDKLGPKNPQYGKSSWNKGVPHSSNTRKKLSEAGKGRIAWNKGIKTGISPPNKGKHPTAEQLTKMSLAMKGRKLTDEHKRKIAEGLKKSSYLRKGRKFSLETLAKMSAARKGKAPSNKGKKASPETIEKLKAWRATIKLPFKDTAPEKIVRQILLGLDVQFSEQKIIRVASSNHPCDFYIPLANLLIEADGDHWHANPNPHTGTNHHEGYAPNIKIGKHEVSKIWEYDRKVNEAAIALGYKMLRIWESELRTDLAGCIEKIRAAIAAAQSIFIQ